MLNEKFSQIFKFERVDEEDDNINLRLIAKKINSEIKSLSRNDHVHKSVTRETLFQLFYLFCSEFNFTQVPKFTTCHHDWEDYNEYSHF